MHQLLILRHAKAAEDSVDGTDRDRALTARGRRDARRVGQFCRDNGLCPDLVLVSASRRTLETLAELEPWPETPLIEAMEPLYLAEPAALLAALRAVPETVRSVMLIGHNPGLHALATMLDDGGAASGRGPFERGFPTAALAEFSIAEAWTRLARGGGRFARFVAPPKNGD